MNIDAIKYAGQKEALHRELNKQLDRMIKAIEEFQENKEDFEKFRDLVGDHLDEIGTLYNAMIKPMEVTK
jgi:hypothetical protein